MNIIQKYAVAALASAGALLIGSTAHAQFGAAPGIGADTNGAEYTITYNGGTSFTVTTSSPDQGPYDAVEDTLINIVNNSSQTLTQIALTGNDIFGFDGDGIDATTYGGSDNSNDNYYGPDNTFNITDANDGTVVFTTPLGAGDETYFSLEGAVTGLSGGNPITVSTGVPDGGSTIAFLGLGIAGLGLLRRRIAALIA